MVRLEGTVEEVVESEMLRRGACWGDACGARGGAPTCDAWCRTPFL
jgi:hypothetical protein